MARNVTKTVLFGGKSKRSKGDVLNISKAPLLMEDVPEIQKAPRSRAKVPDIQKTPNRMENSPEFKKAARRKKKAKKRITVAAVVVVLLAVIYCVAVFSNIPFIKKWRYIYIQTAMETFNHKWLATYFIPASVIAAATAQQDAILEMQHTLQSSWTGPDSSIAPIAVDNYASAEPDTQASFIKKYSELDKTSFAAYISQNQDLIKNGYDHLIINKARLKDTGTSIKTVQGDQVLAIDAENGIIIVKIVGKGYIGKLALVKDPSHVSVGVSKNIGYDGQTVGQIAEGNNAVLAINAGGFADYAASGNGGKVVGLLIAGGKKYSNPIGGSFMNIGFGMDNRLYIDVSTKDVTFRDAIEFFPALVINGKNVISGKDVASGVTAFGIQPRTALGQTKDGTVLMLDVDGRKPGYSLGCTVDECAGILLKYGAYQATNLDGGSSTIMIFRGEVITDPADSTHDGRAVPNAIIVTYANGATIAESHIASGHGGYPVDGSYSGSSGSTKTSAAPTASKSGSPSPSGSASPSPSGSPSPGGTAKPSPSGTASPSPTGTASPSPSGTPKPSPSGTASPSPTGTASPSPSGTASASPSPSSTPSPSPSHAAGTASPTPSATR